MKLTEVSAVPVTVMKEHQTDFNKPSNRFMIISKTLTPKGLGLNESSSIVELSDSHGRIELR